MLKAVDGAPSRRALPRALLRVSVPSSLSWPLFSEEVRLFEYETIVGRTVVLEPLDARHTPDLIRAALVGQSIFEDLRSVHLRDEQAVREWVSESIQMVRHSNHTFLPYAVVDVATGRAIGTTWYINVVERHRRCELGWTWLAPQLHETTIHFETKLLMLEHAFSKCDIERVEFRIDLFDERSQGLLERLGATHEGVLHRDHVDREGNAHDSAIYSITIDRWPALRGRVEERLGGAITTADRERAESQLHAAQEQRLAPQSLELPLPRAG